MTEDTKLNADMVRASQAEALLRSDIFNDAFNVLEAGYIKAWRDTMHDDGIMREHYWMATQVLTDFRNHFARAVTAGRIASKELDFRHALRKSAA